MNKKFYLSKTFWINVLAIIGVIVIGKELSPEKVGVILGGINLLLRFITKKPVEW